MEVIYKTKDIEVVHHKDNDIYVINMLDENGEADSWVPFTKKEMYEFVKAIGVELTKV